MWTANGMRSGLSYNNDIEISISAFKNSETDGTPMPICHIFLCL